MEVKQVANLVNSIQSEILGENSVANEDLENIVEVGKALEDAAGVDNFVKTLVDRIGRTVFVDRVYEGNMPKVMMEGWEFGSILQKIRVEIPDAGETAAWELIDGASYDTQVFHAPTVSATYFNKKLTFTIEMSIPDIQVKSAFISASQMMAFVSMIYNAINNGMTLKVQGLIQRAISNMIGLTMYDEYASTSSFSAASHTKAVNLLYEYNTNVNAGADIDADEALTSKEFLRYAAMRIGQYADRMKVMSKLFNIDGKARFTPESARTTIMHSDFVNAAKSYLYSDTFNQEQVKLPAADVVPYWQGSGTDYGFDSTSAVTVTTTGGQSMTITGVLAVMFDREACAVANVDRRSKSKYNEEGEFTNTWTKWDCELLNDTAENFVVFFIA